MVERPQKRQMSSWEKGLSSAEKLVISPAFSIIVGLIGSVFTVVFAFNKDWKLATACFIASLGLIAAASIVRFYSRQVRLRYEYQHKHEKETFNKTLQNNIDAAEALHKFIHNARDGAGSLCNRAQQLIEQFLEQEQDFRRFIPDFLRARDNFLRQIIEDMLRIFVPLLPPGSQPWAAIREITKEGDVRLYKTLLRAGPVNHDRSQTSEGVREDEGFPRYLRQQHRLGKGIVILGKEKPGEVWKPMANDPRAEDVSIMAGPVFLKSREPYEMPMILYINSPKEGVFNESHKPYMRCCTDTLSMWIGMMVELVPTMYSGREPE